MYDGLFGAVPSTAAQVTAELRNEMGRRLGEFRQYAGQLDAMPASPGKLDLTVGAIDRITQLERFVIGYFQRAAEFRAAGQPDLDALVDFALNDLDGATRIYVQMYQDTAETIARMRQIIDDAQRTATLNTLIAVLNSQVRFDRMMKQIHAVNTSSCANCGVYLGTGAPYWRWCPRCGAAR